MVGLLKALLPPLLFATFAAAQSQNLFEFIQPSSSIWWVAKSTNVMAWDCTSPQAVAANNFTVLITNVDPKVYMGPLAFIAIQANSDCSVTVSQDRVNQPAGTGYTLLFANPLNNTEVYSTSQLFEIKPLGSLYPSQVSSSASAASGTSTASSTASSASSSNGAALSSSSPSFFGLAGIMGLLTAGLLGA